MFVFPGQCYSDIACSGDTVCKDNICVNSEQLSVTNGKVTNNCSQCEWSSSFCYAMGLILSLLKLGCTDGYETVEEFNQLHLDINDTKACGESCNTTNGCTSYGFSETSKLCQLNLDAPTSQETEAQSMIQCQPKIEAGKKRL